MNDVSKSDTLFGGRAAQARYLDGTTEDLRVRQLPLGEYEAAFKLLEDEIALTARICGRDRAWADQLAPESYEALRLLAEEVNANGFFAWSARQVERLRDQQARAFEALAALPPEALEAAYRLGLSERPAGLPATSPTSWPTPAPRRA